MKRTKWKCEECGARCVLKISTAENVRGAQGCLLYDGISTAAWQKVEKVKKKPKKDDQRKDCTNCKHGRRSIVRSMWGINCAPCTAFSAWEPKGE